MNTTIAVARPITHRRSLPRSQRVAPMDMKARIAEAIARQKAPQPDATLLAVVIHLNTTHEQMAGRHAAPLTAGIRARNAAALRAMGPVA